MKQLRITKISIKDWLSFDSLEANTTSDIIEITGDNETGKSSFASAVTWVLNGTDIDGNVLDDVCPVNKEPELSPSVELNMLITDEKGIERPLTLSKTYAAQFSRDKTYKGEHVNVIMVNGVKSTQKALTETIEKQLCDVEIFNMLFNTKVFTEKLKTKAGELKWQKQRRIIESLLDLPDEFEQVQTLEQFADLKNGLLQHGTATQYTKELKTNISKIQLSIEDYPAKKEALEEMLPTTDEFTLEELKENLSNANSSLEELYAENSNYKASANNEAANELIKKVESLRRAQSDMSSTYNNQVQEYKTLHQQLSAEYLELETILNANKAKLEQATARRTEIINIKVSNTCDTCGSLLNEKLVKEQKENIQSRLFKAKEYIENLMKAIETQEKTVNAKRLEISRLTQPQEPDRIKTIGEEITATMQEIANNQTSTDMPDFETRKQEIKDFIEQTNTKINQLSQIEVVSAQIKDLTKANKENIKSRGELQAQLDLCSEFITFRYNDIESKANTFFADTGIEFKMFRKNKTSDDIKETFEIYFNGKEYNSQLSLSTKVLVSYYITKALQTAYNVSVPVIIDNCESVNFNSETFAGTQSFILIRVEEKCPSCNKEVSQRRAINGNWNCPHCGNQWVKKLNIKVGEE